MAEAVEQSLIAVQPHRGAYFVKSFLQRYPEVAAALRGAGAYVVVFAPEPDLEEMEGSQARPSAESVARRTRLALQEAEQTLAPRPGVPVFVAEGVGCYFHLALQGERAPLVGLRASRGLFVGFVECGEGGAIFFAPDGREGRWETARDVVMEHVATLGDRGDLR